MQIILICQIGQSNRCRDIFISRYGFDARTYLDLRTHGLINRDGSSSLCGPVSLIEARRKLQPTISPLPLGSSLIELVHSYFPKWNLPSPVDRGMFPMEVLEASKKLMELGGNQTEVKFRSYDLSAKDLMEANRIDTAAILFHEGWGPLNDIALANQSNRTAGHFSFLKKTKRQLDGSIHGILQDPDFGEIEITLEKAKTPLMPFQTPFRVRFKSENVPSRWRDRDYVRIAAALIIVEVSSSLPPEL